MVTKRGGAVFAVAVLLAVTAAVNASMGLTASSYGATRSVPANTFRTQRIFAGARASSAYDLRDASSGAETNQSSWSAFAADGLSNTTKRWAITFATNRYVDFALNAPLPPAEPLSSVAFNFTFADEKAALGKQACFYFDVRRSSTGAVLQTYGSPAGPIGCEATSTFHPTSTPIPAVTSTDLANDLTVRVYGQETGSQGFSMLIDAATVSGNTPNTAFTLYPKTTTDAADTVPATTPWPIATTADNAVFTPATTWPTSFTASQYLKFTFPAYLPSGSAINSVTLTHTYRPAATGTICYYLDTYAAGTLIGSHGSAAAPASCNSSPTTWLADTIPLPEVNTASRANGLVIKMYVKQSGNTKSQHDALAVTINYSLT